MITVIGKMILKQMKYFVSVVKNNSFTATAEECYISQSAISQQIKILEDEIGTDADDDTIRKILKKVLTLS